MKIDPTWPLRLMHYNPDDPLAARTLWLYIWANRRRLWSFFIYRTLGIACVVPFPFLTKVIVDSSIPERDLRGILLWTSVGLVLIGGHIHTTYICNHQMAIVLPQMMREVRARIFQKLQFMQFGFLDRTQTGKMLAKYAFDTQKIEQSVMPIIHMIIPETLRSIVIVAALAALNIWLLVFLLLVIPIFAAIRYNYQSKVELQNREARLAEARLTGQASEFISAIKLVRGFGQEPEVRASMEGISEHYARMRGSQISLNHNFGMYTFVLSNAINMLAVGFGAFLVINDRMTVGTLIALVGALPAILSPINILTQFAQQYLLGRESYDSIKELLDSSYVEKWTGQLPLPHLRGEINYDTVSFRYGEQDQHALLDVDLHIQAGEHVAIVGPSGSGKSTFVNLLLGLYAPSAGHIRIDGVPQEEIDMRAFRRRCAIVMQDNLLLSGSLLENIRFGKPDASEAEVHEAARLANCLEFVSRLPNGLHTEVGERGVSLSGGQRQRVAIARALLRDPRILILDEATSALDYESERLVQEALDRLSNGRTTITIAHRLSTVRKAHRLIVLRDGRIVEEGTYADLAALSGGYFRELLTAQA